MSVPSPGAKLRAKWVAGAGGQLSPLRIIGADGVIGGSGAAKGVPVSQSHNERLSGRRARPSQEGGALDQIAQPPSCIPITHTIESRYHILLMPLISLVGLQDMMARAKSAGDATREPFTYILLAAAIYLAITSVSLLVLRYLERRYSVGVKAAEL